VADPTVLSHSVDDPLPARHGSPRGFLETVITPDGRGIQISAGNPND
jgi:hypothetical protein